MLSEWMYELLQRVSEVLSDAKEWWCTEVTEAAKKRSFLKRKLLSKN
jgi:hypothetical protein